MAEQASAPGRRSYIASGSGEEVRRWEAYNAEELIAVRCGVPDAQPLRAKQTNFELPRVQTATITGSPHRVSRPADLVERYPTDSVAVYLILGAAGAFESNGRRRVVQHGEVIVCDADQPFDREFGHGVSEFAVKAGTAQLRDALGIDVRVERALLSPQGDLATHALTRAAASVIRTAGTMPVDELGTLELVGLLATGDAAPSDVRHRVAARAYIDEHLPDREMSARRVADAAGISERQLSRVFAAIGVSVPQYILGRRLELARSILLGRPATSTAAAARAAGLVSRAHFSRAFQDRFGVTAGSIRRTADDPEVPVSAIPAHNARATRM